ncbi:DUF1921 domain-containing protein [Pseudomonas sp. Z1-29]|uniref:glucan 1,4-alpha-maltotetraohydrolase domain-containing protein n=1 Tax=unclassified Pseudomonas TaxID=196821 RepID=UPI003DA88DEE
MKRTSLPGLLLGIVLALPAMAATDAVRNGSAEEILLQGFHWNSSRNTEKWYPVLSRMANTIGADGFTAIWMPPPWADQSSWNNGTVSGGGEGYFWHSFEKDGRYGTDAQLRQAAAALNKAGVKVIYDVVPNHMAERDGPSMFVRGSGEWRQDCRPACDEGDAFDEGDPDLNTGNQRVAETFKNEFINLRDNYGAQGLRFDFVRGYAPETVDKWMEAFGSQQFCVGENWKSPNEYPPSDWRHGASWQEVLKDWSDRSHCPVFDFALKERMQNGPIAEWRHGLNGNPDPAWRRIAVTFVDNHDTGYSPGAYGGQHHWPVADALINQAYAYILSSPGTPTVYWAHMYDWQRDELIRRLIKLRKDAGIRADSPIRFHPNYSGLVATTSGSRKALVIALQSDLQQLPQGMQAAALEWDNGAIRIWSIPAEPPQVSVSFHCDNPGAQHGESVYAVGSSLELGAWDPRHAVPLEGSNNRRSSVIQLPAQQQVEWKCMVRRQDSAEIRWQPGPNVSFTSDTAYETTGRL